MTLSCNLDDSNIIFQKLLQKINAIGINHMLTKNTFTKDKNQFIENKDNNSNNNKNEYIHDFEKQYYLNLKQLNNFNKNKFEILDEEDNKNMNKSQQKASFLEINSTVSFNLKLRL